MINQQKGDIMGLFGGKKWGKGFISRRQASGIEDVLAGSFGVSQVIGMDGKIAALSEELTVINNSEISNLDFSDEETKKMYKENSVIIPGKATELYLRLNHMREYICRWVAESVGEEYSWDSWGDRMPDPELISPGLYNSSKQIVRMLMPKKMVRLYIKDLEYDLAELKKSPTERTPFYFCPAKEGVKMLMDVVAKYKVPEVAVAEAERRMEKISPGYNQQLDSSREKKPASAPTSENNPLSLKFMSFGKPPFNYRLWINDYLAVERKLDFEKQYFLGR